MRQTIQSNLSMLGRRYPHKINYRVGFDDNGKLLGIDVKMYQGLGCLPNEKAASFVAAFIDNGIQFRNFYLSCSVIATH